jgi:ATP-dependent RNA helicase SUPV3L1/SUV3
MADIPVGPAGGGIVALLGPTNTGKTHRAVERMLSHASGMIGLPLRLLAREVYDRITARIGENAVALVTGEEKRVPRRPRYWVCTVESMPISLEVDFVAVDEIQLVAHRQRGHTFTDRLLHARGRLETWFLGSETARPLVNELLPTASIHRDPRLSRLSYSGLHSLGSLPPRTAVVAFSVEDVYEIAERLRRRHGGTAVVLGALSPRTRNAQVAMYQAGEVQHLVATDAIGMGLNLDLDRVVFAALRKFDGKELRTLEAAELAQIAGRAGRHTRDGTFGTLRSAHGSTTRGPVLHPRVVAAIEQHAFSPLHRAVWRNSDLDFSRLETLVDTLRRRPSHPRLQLVERCEDFEALTQLARRDDVRKRAVGSEAVELLWDVCRIPDFRKLLLDSHVELLDAIFAQLSGPGERIDRDWMAKRVARLDDPDGDIETLMNRLAFVRTWTYITNHDRWVHEAAHWRGVTRDIEDRLSDALHQRLTERFVDDRNPGQVRPAARRSRPARSQARATSVNPDSPFGRLLELELPDAPGEDDVDDAQRWVQSLVDARFDAFDVDEHGRITFEGEVVAQLRRGADVLHPEVLPVHAWACDVGKGDVARVLRRLMAWIRDAVGELLGPLRRLDAGALGPAGRGLVYQLEQGLGTVDVVDAAAQASALTNEDKERLQHEGIVIGEAAVYLPRGLRPRSIRLRAALWSAHETQRDPSLIPPPGAVSVRLREHDDRSFYPRVGYVVRGALAIRADQLERAFAWLRSDAANHTPAVPQLGVTLGCAKRRLPAVLAAMGYHLDEQGRARLQRSGGRRPRRGRGRRAGAATARAEHRSKVGSAG